MGAAKEDRVVPLSGERRFRVDALKIPVLGTIIPIMGTSLSTSPAVASRRRGDPGDSTLADALFTLSQQRVLALLFGQPDRQFFVTEIIALAGCGRGAVQRELARLARSGLVIRSRAGNRTYYRANRDAPVFDEICGIVRKTVGRRSVHPWRP